MVNSHVTQRAACTGERGLYTRPPQDRPRGPDSHGMVNAWMHICSRTHKANIQSHTDAGKGVCMHTYARVEA